MNDDDARQRDADLIVRHVRDRGYQVSTHRLSASLLGTIPAAVDMHAVYTSTDPPRIYVVNVKGDTPVHYYAAAVELARMIGIQLDD